MQGVFDGVTGIVRKPVEGAKEEGTKGFFKGWLRLCFSCDFEVVRNARYVAGIGKGLVGVVTRPTSGIVDFASSSLAGVKRLTDLTREVERVRPARFIAADGIVRPYRFVQAEGNAVLKVLLLCFQLIH